MITMKQRKIDKQIEASARRISSHTSRPWYICRRAGSNDVVVSELDLKRYMHLGYSVLCAYFDGKRYKNIYTLDGQMEFI